MFLHTILHWGQWSTLENKWSYMGGKVGGTPRRWGPSKLSEMVERGLLPAKFELILASRTSYYWWKKGTGLMEARNHGWGPESSACSPMLSSPHGKGENHPQQRAVLSTVERFSTEMGEVTVKCTVWLACLTVGHGGINLHLRVRKMQIIIAWSNNSIFVCEIYVRSCKSYAEEYDYNPITTMSRV